MKPVLIPLGYDLQALHDHAAALSYAYGEMADRLGMSPSVCTHRFTPKGDVDGDTVACSACGHLVPIWMTDV